MLLAAAPTVAASPPRIISEIRKREPVTTGPMAHVKPRISGDLLVILASERTWWPRRVSVRAGQLLVSSGPGEASPPTLRIPLRQLSLRAGRLPNSLALCKGQNVLLTLQTGSEHAFDLWVKTIAIELIRQTPLDSVKYLDILSLTWNRKETTATASDEKPATTPSNPPAPAAPDVETLLKKCQNPESYVPVKEKLMLFESLCRLGRKVRSTEDVTAKPEVETTKRARSLHDLSSCLGAHVAVREMCRYFEGKSEQNNEDKCPGSWRNRRLISSDSQLNHVQMFNKRDVCCA